MKSGRYYSKATFKEGSSKILKGSQHRGGEGGGPLRGGKKVFRKFVGDTRRLMGLSYTLTLASRSRKVNFNVGGRGVVENSIVEK